MELLPPAPCPEAFEHVRADESRLRPGVDAICGRLGLGGEPILRFADGSLPVYAVGEQHVLKLYPPFDISERDREALVLRVLEGKLPITTPALRAVGELLDWGYLLMQRLPGQSLVLAFAAIPRAQQEGLAAALGEALAELHRLSDARLEPLRIN